MQIQNYIVLQLIKLVALLDKIIKHKYKLQSDLLFQCN